MADTPPIPKKRSRMVTVLMEIFGLSPTAALAVITAVCLLFLSAAAWVFHSAPPHTITVVTGPEGSTFQRYAERYQKILAANGFELRVLPSGGSLDNLQRLQAEGSTIDFGFVQGGLTEGVIPKNLQSLGSVAYQPVWIFYRNPTPLSRLSELAGKRIAVGAMGSGTHALALTLLMANGITPDKATLVDDDASAAANGLIEGRLDAIFLMGEAAPVQTLRTMIRAPGIRIFNFEQADAYVRRYAYLNRMRLPEGSFDLGQNLPSEDITLVGPTVELVAQKGLNPALVELLIDTAREVHSRASILQKAGEFPAPLEHEFAISDDVRTYYKSGKSFIARKIHSVWLASLVNPILVVLIPAALLLIPVLRFLPIAYRLRIHLRIYRCYRPLLQLEREVTGPLTAERIQQLMAKLDEVERNVDRLKVPASFGDQFYELRQHVQFVRRRLKLVQTRMEAPRG